MNIRTPEWELSGFQFLVGINPKKYELKHRSIVEGMVDQWTLIDRITKKQIGNVISRNNVNNTMTQFSELVGHEDW